MAWAATVLAALPSLPALTALSLPTRCSVLIFLEALALQRQPPAFGLHLCPQLLEAAQQLGLRALEVGGRRQA